MGNVSCDVERIFFLFVFFEGVVIEIYICVFICDKSYYLLVVMCIVYRLKCLYILWKYIVFVYVENIYR